MSTNSGSAEKTQSIRLFRAGSPDRGAAFWTPNEDYARKLCPDLAMHSAMLLPGFELERFHFSRSDPLAQHLAQPSGEVAAQVFSSPDGQHEEYLVLNPACLQILQ